MAGSSHYQTEEVAKNTYFTAIYKSMPSAYKTAASLGRCIGGITGKKFCRTA